MKKRQQIDLSLSYIVTNEIKLLTLRKNSWKMVG
jgi:hypothetical protein